MTEDEKLENLVNASGFPLQIGIANVVAATTHQHHWRVLTEEHSWVNVQDERDGFLDLVLINGRQNCVLAVECKRAFDETWLFLQPDKKTDVRRAKAWVYAVVRFQRDLQWKLCDWRQRYRSCSRFSLRLGRLFFVGYLHFIFRRRGDL